MPENLTDLTGSLETNLETTRQRSLTADERETIIRISDGDDLVHIDTTRRIDITALRKKPDATETDSGFYGATAWATFTIPKKRFSAARGVKAQPREMTEEQRQAAGDRLRALRANKSNGNEEARP